MRLLGLLAALALAAGCLVDHGSALPEDFASCPDDGAAAAPASRPLTYYQDAKPIIDARCAGCHREGGIGPFSLESYDDVFFNKEASRSAIASGRMPPWDPDGCCREYLHDRSLTGEQERLLLDWIDRGAAPGDPMDPAPPIDSADSGLSRVDLTLQMPEPFTPRPVVGNDEIRCFLIDWPLADDRYVTGIDVVPGNPELVHHVVVMAIAAEDGERLAERDGADGRPGFDCWGDLGARPEASIGGWTPGQSGYDFPAGLGREIPGGTRVLLQMHYDTSSGSTEPDQTRIELKLDESAERHAATLPVGNPQWLLGDGLFIAAGDPDAMYSFAYDPTTVIGRGRPIEVFSATIHMHDYGSAGSVAILRRDGSVECLLHAPRFDFSWHGEYFFAEPAIIEPGDRIYVECHFDNTASNQRLIDGELQEPRDLHWATDQEMCGALLMMAELDR